MPDDKDHPLSSANIFKAIGASLDAEQAEHEAWEKDPNAHHFKVGEGVEFAHDNDDNLKPSLSTADASDAKKMTPAEYEKHLASKGLNKPL
jgi:hypothetical protein